MRSRHTVKKMRGGETTKTKYNPLLITAVNEGDIEQVKRLLKSNPPPDIDEKGVSGVTALIVASAKSSTEDRNPEIVKLLLEEGANVNIETDSGITPLMGASLDGNDEIVELLLEKSPELNKQDKISDMTALMAAAKGGHYEVVKLLLEAGVDKTITNKRGLRASDIAAKNKHTKVADLIRGSVSVNINNVPRNMKPPQLRNHWASLRKLNLRTKHPVRNNKK